MVDLAAGIASLAGSTRGTHEACDYDGTHEACDYDDGRARQAPTRGATTTIEASR